MASKSPLQSRPNFQSTDFHGAASLAGPVCLALALIISIIALQPLEVWAQNPAGWENVTAAALRTAVDSPGRPTADKARDRYRHPVETLTFFGIKPDMTVVEIWPGAGWYTEILAAFLKQHGKLYAAALKPGGILGLTEHRGDRTQPQDPKAATGYVQEDRVIKLAEQAGFQLAGRSEINANPKDTKNYPAGVWTLPPTLRLGDVDRSKYLAIGESDRMTLKFIKPLKTTAR
jgi:predicted methyltransferase